jgi:Calcineurin-like phosphoesterase.
LQKLYDLVKDVDYDFTVFNGDNINDSESDNAIYGEISVINDVVKGYTKPIIFVRGNHEIRGASAPNIKKLCWPF